MDKKTTAVRISRKAADAFLSDIFLSDIPELTDHQENDILLDGELLLVLLDEDLARLRDRDREAAPALRDAIEAAVGLKSPAL